MLRVFRALVIVNVSALLLLTLWTQNELVNNQFLQAWLQAHGLLSLFSWIPGVLGGMAIGTLFLTFFRWKELAGVFDAKEAEIEWEFEATGKPDNASSQS